MVVGSVGSKNPCECWRGRCLCTSLDGDEFLVGISLFGGGSGAPGREKLGREVLLLFAPAGAGAPRDDPDVGLRTCGFRL